MNSFDYLQVLSSMIEMALESLNGATLNAFHPFQFRSFQIDVDELNALAKRQGWPDLIVSTMDREFIESADKLESTYRRRVSVSIRDPWHEHNFSATAEWEEVESKSTIEGCRKSTVCSKQIKPFPIEEFRSSLNELLESIPLMLRIEELAQAEPPDTKTDTKKKSRKKFSMNAAAGACSVYVRKALKNDPDMPRKTAVLEWAESLGGVFDGKPIKVKYIDKILQNNPDTWKPDGI